jgi:hypothetical protein
VAYIQKDWASYKVFQAHVSDSEKLENCGYGLDSIMVDFLSCYFLADQLEYRFLIGFNKSFSLTLKR